ncbi:TetR/AcrR family transcriptional regulator [Gallaecimonas mangrovi]|uniref:TetR/AcrR family transcriptional regulator n=1 Tax=Gallaecimonas mangrovi TaxID=2291597 RepID=UPI000E1FD849|nr:TetR/AcrR family transcriptional regulator [Gallaecimonas mangrovi]
MSAQEKVVSFSKEAFAKTSPKRQDKILTEAIKAFAEHGFAGTNINDIARDAGVSIGAMYSYFSSKEDLFLTIVSQQFGLLQQILDSIDIEQDFFDSLTQLFELTRANALKHAHLSQIYLDITSQSMAPMAQKLSGQFEDPVVSFLLSLIEKARKSGSIRPDVNGNVLAFCIDNLLTMFQFSFSSSYYQARMQLYIGDNIADDALIPAMLKIIKNQL